VRCGPRPGVRCRASKSRRASGCSGMGAPTSGAGRTTRHYTTRPLADWQSPLSSGRSPSSPTPARPNR
jgi:hypothetical protein